MASKKKALFILHYPPPIHGAAMMGDIIRKSEFLQENLDARFLKIDSSGELDDIGRVNLNKIWLTLCFGIKTLWWTLTFRPDVVHYFSTSQGIAFWRDYLVSLFFKLLSIFKSVSIYYHYEAKYTIGRKWEKKLSKLYFKRASIVVMSEELINDFKVLPFWRNLTFYTLPNTCKELITEENYRKQLSSKTKDSCSNYLYLSNMIESKGYLHVLEVAADLVRQNKQVIFSFAGGWVTPQDEEDFKAKVKKLGLEEYVRIYGRVNDAQKIDLLSWSHFLIFPTFYHNEAFPLVLVEALQFGVLPLTYVNGGTPSIVSADLGWIVERKDLDTLKKVALTAFERPNYEKMANQARTKYLNKYQLSHFESRLFSILDGKIDPVELV